MSAYRWMLKFWKRTDPGNVLLNSTCRMMLIRHVSLAQVYYGLNKWSKQCILQRHYIQRYSVMNNKYFALSGR